MNLERGKDRRGRELGLPVGTILVNQLEYIVEVLIKFAPSLQLRTRTTPGNRFAIRTLQGTRTSTPAEQAAYLDALHELYAVRIGRLL